MWIFIIFSIPLKFILFQQNDEVKNNLKYHFYNKYALKSISMKVQVISLSYNNLFPKSFLNLYSQQTQSKLVYPVLVHWDSSGLTTLLYQISSHLSISNACTIFMIAIISLWFSSYSCWVIKNSLNIRLIPNNSSYSRSLH